MSDNGSDTWIIEVAMAPAQGVLFQALLSGEDGLAVVRCRDPEGLRQQLWTTEIQRQGVLDWLAGLPQKLEVEILDERPWREGA